MTSDVLILLGAAAVIGLIALAVDAVTVRRYRALRTRRLIRQLRGRVSTLEADLRHAEAERDGISAELDEAYLSGAALADRYWHAERRTGRQLVRNVKRRAAIVRIARYCRETADTWDIAVDYVSGVMDQLREQIDARDRAIDALTRRVAELMRGPACTNLDAFFDAELYPDEADAFRVHLATCERCQRVLHGRMQEQVAAGRSRCDDRIPFIDGELNAERAEAFRAHLRGCEACRQELTGDAGLAARLSTLDPEVRR